VVGGVINGVVKVGHEMRGVVRFAPANLG